jgi:N-sulfoglucosamine sulfohydrolase
MQSQRAKTQQENGSMKKYENDPRQRRASVRLMSQVTIIVQLALVFVPCEYVRAADETRLNIVLFVTDDQSPDVGAYGNAVIKTPNMDALARDGVLFRNAFCTTASCSASRSVILSGLHNHFNGQYGHEHAYHHFSSFDRVKSLPVRLTESGYETIRVGKYHVAPESVYKFDVALSGNARNPVQMADKVEEYLAKRNKESPFFLYFCTADPHRGGGERTDLANSPDAFGNIPEGYEGVESTYYNPAEVPVPSFLPDTPTARSELAMYSESISRIDQGLGRLIQHLKDAGIYERTVIIFTSDHGMAFPGAKTTLYEPGMRVPMIVHDPRLTTRGTENIAMLSHVDLTPTILDMASVLGNKDNHPQDFHGRSWAGILGQHKPSGWDEVFASHTFHEIQMYYPMKVVHGRRYKLIWNIAYQLPYPFASDLWAASTWKDRYQQGPDTLYGKRTVARYIHRPQFELFDLQEDPDEVNNLAEMPEHIELLENLKAKIKIYQSKTKDPWIMKWDYE